MINEKDIQKRLAELLTADGFRVVSGETEEGFERAAAFISVYPARIALEGPGMENVTDEVEISYHPAVRTVEHLSDTAQKLRDLLMYKPLEVGDRKLTIQEIEFEIEGLVLSARFELDYYQETPNVYEEYDAMEELVLGGDI